jgi:hypothetical protein
MFTRPYILFIVLFTLVLPGVESLAQDVRMYFKDGSSTAYAVSLIRNMSYSNNQMVILQNDGSLIRIPLSIIQRLEFENEIVSTRPLNPLQFEIKLYPNPAKDVMQIQIPSSFSDNYLIEFAAINGFVVFSGKIPENESIYRWFIPDELPVGVYVCRILTNDAVFSSLFMIKR